jgi:hypothetical protein
VGHLNRVSHADHTRNVETKQLDNGIGYRVGWACDLAERHSTVCWTRQRFLREQSSIETCLGSAEGERKSFRSRIEKLDLEISINDGLWLPNQLIHPRSGNRAVALVVYVNAMSSARRLSIYERAKSHGSSGRRRSHDRLTPNPPVSGSRKETQCDEDGAETLCCQRRRRTNCHFQDDNSGCDSQNSICFGGMRWGAHLRRKELPLPVIPRIRVCATSLVCRLRK